MVLQKDSEKFVLVDVNALVHRAYHAYPETLSVDGVPTNAAYGFTVLLLEVITKFSPKYVICSVDAGKAEKRIAIYKEYKATRKPMDENLRVQVPIIHDIIQSLNIPIYSKPGYEADDVIGTIVNMKNIEGRKGLETIIVTGDKDIFQLVDDDTYVYLAGSSFSKSKLYGIAEVKEKMGFGPDYIIDYKALRGDPSDNIPGIFGIGDKSAVELIGQFGHLDNVFDNLESIQSPRIKKALAGKKSEADMSRELARIITDVPLEFDLNNEAVVFKSIDQESFIRICEKYRFSTILRKYKLDNTIKSTGKPSGAQIDMFSNGAQKEESNDLDYVIVDDSNIDELFDAFSKYREFAFDTETSSLSVLNSSLLGVSIAFEAGRAFYITRDTIDNPLIKKELKRVFGGEDYKKIAHNIKFDIQALSLVGIEVKGEIFDTMLAAYIAQMGEGPVGLKDLARKYFNLELRSFKDLARSAEVRGHFETIPLEEIARYCCYDSKVSFGLYQHVFMKTLSLEENKDLLKILTNIELPLIRVLDRMERTGITLDASYLQKFAGELDRDIHNLQKKIFDLAGISFNLNSPKQLGDILFAKLGLTGIKKTSTGAYSTDERVLREIIGQHEIISLLLEYRELSKLRNTYTDSLVAKISSETGRVHTTYNQAVASTGRLSSSEPNLQNIPVSSDMGNKIRKAFVAGTGKIFVSLDYSQQELRILSAVSQDEELVRSYKKNIDVHALTASRLFEVDLDKVTKEQRAQGKTVNFSIIYGISSFGLADRLKIPRDVAQHFIDRYFEIYPGVGKFFKELLDQARIKGYVQTLYGRRRTAEGLLSRNFRVRSAVEREVINFPIQGGAADMMKLAMIKVDKLMRESKWKDYKMVVQVHDELLFEVPGKVKDERGISWNDYLQQDSKLVEFIQEIEDIMLKVNQYRVPMMVDVSLGKKWGDMVEVL